MNDGTSNGFQPLHFGIDFDGTFSADPELWRRFIALAESRGHRCYVVTCRRDTDENREDIGPHVTGLPRYRHLFTGLSPKRWFCEQQCTRIDVWIDDQPESVINGR